MENGACSNSKCFPALPVLAPVRSSIRISIRISVCAMRAPYIAFPTPEGQVLPAKVFIKKETKNCRLIQALEDFHKFPSLIVYTNAREQARTSKKSGFRDLKDHAGFHYLTRPGIFGKCLVLYKIFLMCNRLINNCLS